MDEIDDRILGILATNGRASFAAIGEEVGLSPHGAADRVRRLERDGVISGYAARMHPPPATRPPTPPPSPAASPSSSASPAATPTTSTTRSAQSAATPAPPAP